MHELTIDWNELELAFREISGTQNYFDLRTGSVVSVVAGYEDEDEVQTLIQQHPSRFKAIAPLDANYSRAVLSRFLNKISQKQLRAELELTLKGPAGLTRSMELLKANGAYMSAYSRYEQETFWLHLREFLSACDVKPTNRAPEPELFHEVA